MFCSVNFTQNTIGITTLQRHLPHKMVLKICLASCYKISNYCHSDSGFLKPHCRAVSLSVTQAAVRLMLSERQRCGAECVKLQMCYPKRTVRGAIPHFLGSLQRSLVPVLGSPVWKEHHQEQTFKGSISSTASGARRVTEKGLFVCWDHGPFFCCVWLVKKSMLQDASAVSEASVTTGNSIVPHDFLV